MLTDVQAYCVTFLICLFRPALTAAKIYRKTTEAKFYTSYKIVLMSLNMMYWSVAKIDGRTVGTLGFPIFNQSNQIFF